MATTSRSPSVSHGGIAYFPPKLELCRVLVFVGFRVRSIVDAGSTVLCYDMRILLKFAIQECTYVYWGRTYARHPWMKTVWHPWMKTKPAVWVDMTEAMADTLLVLRSRAMLVTHELAS